MQLTAIAWNIFHGRDFPPDPELFTWRSRLLRITERNATHAQVNRDLAAEFAAMLAGAEWDVALLQECPPRFAAPLARACCADAHRALTSRNSLGALRAAAARLNPDLIASAEGGSNLTLVRRSAPNPQRCALPAHNRAKEQRGGGIGGIVERRELVIHEGRPERRAMAFTRIATSTGTRDGPELCVANLHATADRPELAAVDVLLAAAAATEWAGEAPLLFGGDFNLRPKTDAGVFDELRERFGLAGPTGPGAIDHLLVRGLEVVDRPTPWPPERREVRELAAPTTERLVREDGLALRLSDHAPVEGRFATRDSRE